MNKCPIILTVDSTQHVHKFILKYYKVISTHLWSCYSHAIVYMCLDARKAQTGNILKSKKNSLWVELSHETAGDLKKKERKKKKHFWLLLQKEEEKTN